MEVKWYRVELTDKTMDHAKRDRADCHCFDPYALEVFHFLHQLRLELVRLEQAIEQGDTMCIRNTAHRAGEMAEGYYLFDLARAAERLESDTCTCDLGMTLESLILLRYKVEVASICIEMQKRGRLLFTWEVDVMRKEPDVVAFPPVQ